MTSPRTSYLRPLVALVALVAAMAALLIAYNASPTYAAPVCSTTAGTTTCTFSSTGEEQTFVVPEGVSSVHVIATGAPGAAGDQGSAGGRGAVVSGDLTVEPGHTLYVEVGGAPTKGSNCSVIVACNGGFNGGGSSDAFGGGGGGASDVRTISRNQSPGIPGELSRLIVAAGGGGGGGGFGGGSGGDAGSDGGDGAPGTGGKAGTQSAGGAGGIPDGQRGLLGLGGDAAEANRAGGAGGGGYYGGGSGASNGGGERSSGGGGGGSSLVPTTGGSGPTITSAPPSITISYRTGGVGEPPPTEQPQSKEDCKKGGWKEFGFKNQGQCIKAVNHPS